MMSVGSSASQDAAARALVLRHEGAESVAAFEVAPIADQHVGVPFAVRLSAVDETGRLVETFEAIDRVNGLEQAESDLRLACSQLRRQPGLAATAIVLVAAALLPQPSTGGSRRWPAAPTCSTA